MKKKLLLSAALALSVTAASATDFTADGVKYTVNPDGQSVTIAQQDASISGAVSIPSQVTYEGSTYSVTGLAGGAFKECTNLTSITLPSTLVNVGVTTVNPRNYYSNYSSRPSEVVVPTSYEGSGAFAGCTSLTTVNMGDCGFTETMGAMFAGCTALATVTMPNTLEVLTGYDFLLCKSLRTLNLTNCSGLTEIGEYSFHQKKAESDEERYGLRYVYVPASLETIGTSAFYQNDLQKITDLGTASSPTQAQVDALPYLTTTSDITQVSHLSNVSSLGDYAFGQNWSLHAMVLGSDELQTIPESCFASAFDLRWIILSDNVTTIGDNAFKGLGNLHSMANLSGDVKVVSYTTLSDNNILRLPTSLTSIGKCAFKACSSIATMKCYATTAPELWRSYSFLFFTIDENNTFDTSHQSIQMYVPSGATSYYTVGTATNTRQQCWGFYSYITITDNLPNPETTNGVIPNLSRTMAKVGSSSAPYYYKGIPFELNETEGTAKVLKLENNANIPEEDGSYSQKITAYGGATMYVGDVIVPEKLIVDSKEYTVTSIANDAFGTQMLMTSIELPKTITSFETGSAYMAPLVSTIEKDVLFWTQNNENNGAGISALFADCIALKKAVINAQVTQLGKYCFAGCYLLSDLTLPNTLTTIDEGAFGCCYSLPEIAIPENVTSIGNGAFYLASLPTDATSIDDYFYFTNRTPGMTRESIEQFINGICGANTVNYSDILNNRLNSKQLSISVTGSISSYAFYKCAQLEGLSFSAAVIGGNAFGGTNVSRVQISGATKVDSNPFDNTKSINILIPQNSIANYSALTNVENFRVAERHARTLTADKFGSLCLGYDAKVPEGVTLYEVVEANYDETDASVLKSITIDEVDTSVEDFKIEAGKPYFFLATAGGEKDFEAIDAFTCTNEAGENNGLHGALTKTDVTAGVLMLKDNTLYPAATGSTCSANRAWLVASEVVNSESAPSRRAVRFNFDGNATGIATLDCQAITSSDNCYDLQGRRVSAAQKGVYIQNGRKVVR